MSNGGNLERWLAHWRRLLPGAGEEEVGRRANISQDRRGGGGPLGGPRGMGGQPRGRGGIPDFGNLPDDALKLWQDFLRGIQTYRKAWADVQDWATRGQPGQPASWSQWSEQVGGMARRGAERGMEYLRTPFTQWPP